MWINNDPGIFAPSERRNRLLDLGGIVHAARRRFHSEARRGCFERIPERLMNGCLGVHEHQDASDVGCGLFQDLQPLASDRPVGASKTGDVPDRMGKARNESIAYWVS